jgi:DNA-binding MarR family transcriptional regulator
MKQDLRLKKIRDCLLTHDKATPSEIAKETGILQPKELSYDLKKLRGQGEITWEEDPKDGRKKWYRLKRKDKALAESRRYDIIQYIEDLKEPIFAEVKASEGDYGVRTSIFFEGPLMSSMKQSKKDHEIKESLQEMLERVVKKLAQEMKIRGLFEPPLFTKTVTVWVHEVHEERAKENFERVKKELAKQSGKKEEK